MISEVRVERVDRVPLAVIRRRASASDLSRLVPELCGAVWNTLRTQQRKGGRHVAVYLDGDINVEVGAEMSGDFEDQGEVVHSSTPAGDVAHVTHFGPYQNLGAAYDAIHSWASAHGHRLAGPRWEVYGHWDDAWNANPSLIRTDIYCQVAPAR